MLKGQSELDYCSVMIGALAFSKLANNLFIKQAQSSGVEDIEDILRLLGENAQQISQDIVNSVESIEIDYNRFN